MEETSARNMVIEFTSPNHNPFSLTFLDDSSSYPKIVGTTSMM